MSDDRPRHDELSALIRRLRMLCFGKQMALAAAMRCSEATLSHWESGRRTPAPERLRRLIETLRTEGAPDSDLALLERLGAAAVRRVRNRRGCRQIADSTEEVA